jgi:hypothetical protein
LEGDLMVGFKDPGAKKGENQWQRHHYWMTKAQYDAMVEGNRQAAARMMAAERTRIEEARRTGSGGGGVPRGMMALTFALGAFASVAAPRRRARR